jgi:hypothetical protein
MNPSQKADIYIILEFGSILPLHIFVSMLFANSEFMWFDNCSIKLHPNLLKNTNVCGL